MDKIVVGPQVKLLLRVLEEHGEAVYGDPLSAEEWEAACTVMGLQVAFQGDLPAPVTEECRRTMQEVALRTGLPLHLLARQRPEEGR